MSKKIAFLFPGQGAQYAGMGKGFFDHFLVAKRTFEEANDILSLNFSNLIFEGPDSLLTLTKNSQVAIFIVSIAILRTLQEQFPQLEAAVCAGLSLGEYTALVASGKLSFSECLKLVQARGQFMHESCEAHEGSMRVILGLENEEVEEVVSELEEEHQVWVANLNCPEQVVISGSKEGLDVASDLLKEKGAKRVLPLDVSGAFHSGLMGDAKNRLAEKIKGVHFAESPIDLVMNVPGDYVSSFDDMKEFLVDQVTSPVRWEKGIRAIAERGVDLYMEIGCGKTLSGMNRKIGIKEKTVSIEHIEDLDVFAKVWKE